MMLTISAQSPASVPYPLPKGLTLYSAEVCTNAAETRPRAISAGRIRQEFEDRGGQYSDPQLMPPMISRYVAHTLAGRLLGVVSWGSTGGSIASAAVTTYKATQNPIGNAKTWAEVATVLGVLGAGIPIAQHALQSDVQAQRATITNGVQAAMITDMTQIYDVPASGGCARSIMFLGSGIAGLKAVVQ